MTKSAEIDVVRHPRARRAKLSLDPASGRVTAVVDLRAIVAEVGLSNDIEAVANGIAWDAQGRRLFITGKRWPTLFEIRLPG